MTNFVFNAANAAIGSTLDLSTGVYYSHLVTAIPPITATTVAQLTMISNAPSYAPVILTGLSYTATKWTFSDFSFPKLVFATAPIGHVVCKRLGASPAMTDPVICYSDFVNSVDQIIIPGVGAYSQVVRFGVNGAISFTNRFEYSSGAYISGANAGFPYGLIYLLGSNNNTQAFSNPSPSKIKVYAGQSPSYSLVTDKTDRTSISSFVDSIVLDFAPGVVKVADVGIIASASATIYGAKTLPNTTATEFDNLGLWTSLGQIPTTGVGWRLIANTLNPTEYYRFLMIRLGSIDSIEEIELYNSSILWPNINLV
jgi:hypothetical protein